MEKSNVQINAQATRRIVLPPPAHWPRPSLTPSHESYGALCFQWVIPFLPDFKKPGAGSGRAGYRFRNGT
ncbi:hypothetical protein DSCA_01960 [Desulfosarcina alkanivorans]|uniref:Uncharacterized protein n=1 Tax=Desulfosarcina alkanivorans TaxID=571177 RepID=A0A5K7YBH8_9BACT|nr:hypothetical protein DSCA_01960 [Desulfosarcina alkanivorans]